jgi:hypothetical protein
MNSLTITRRSSVPGAAWPRLTVVGVFGQPHPDRARAQVDLGVESAHAQPPNAPGFRPFRRLDIAVGCGHRGAMKDSPAIAPQRPDTAASPFGCL